MKRLENCAQRVNGSLAMKSQLIAIVAGVVLVGCGVLSGIHKAAKEGDIEAAKKAIANGADVNAKDYQERTPLHWTAWRRHKEIAELLIAAGADVNVKDSDDKTPLDLAAQFRYKEIADLLRKHGGKTWKELKAEGK